MKKLIIFFVLVLIFVLGIVVYKFRGTAPSILPPLEVKKDQGTGTNDLGFTIPKELKMNVFAKNLSAPRALVFDTKGTLIASVPSEGKVVALPDKNNDGQADETIDLLTGLERPHGITFREGKLYVAQVQNIFSYDYNDAEISASNPQKIADLPEGGRHFTRTIHFGPDRKLYISIGSTCDVCVEKDGRNGSILVADLATQKTEIFASGLRNAVFFVFNEGKIWATEMGRDFLGDNLPPDEVNIVEAGKNYGWPYCYGDKVTDEKFGSPSSLFCQSTEAPVYKICAHCAPLGLAFINSEKFSKDWQGDLLVSYHGSWNSSKPVGYKVVRLNLENGKVVSEEDFISGFLSGLTTKGRPADLAFSPDGALFLSDDKAGVIYKIEP